MEPLRAGIAPFVQASPACPVFEPWLEHIDIDQFVPEEKWRNLSDHRTKPTGIGKFGISGYRLEEKLSLGGTADFDAAERDSGPDTRERLLEICAQFNADPRFDVYISRSANGFHAVWNWAEPIPAPDRSYHAALCREFLEPVLHEMGIERREVCSIGGILYFWTTKETHPNAFRILSRAEQRPEAPTMSPTIAPTIAQRWTRPTVQPTGMVQPIEEMSDDQILDALSCNRPSLLTRRCLKFLDLCKAIQTHNGQGEVVFHSHWNLIERACRILAIPFESPITGKDLTQPNVCLNVRAYGFDAVDFSRHDKDPKFKQSIFVG